MCYIPGSARECPICHREEFSYYDPVRCLTYERCEWHRTRNSDLPKRIQAWFEKRVCKACLDERERLGISEKWYDDDDIDVDGRYRAERERESGSCGSDTKPDEGKGKYRSTDRSPSPLNVESSSSTRDEGNNQCDKGKGRSRSSDRSPLPIKLGSSSSRRDDAGHKVGMLTGKYRSTNRSPSPESSPSSSSRHAGSGPKNPSRRVTFVDVPEEDEHKDRIHQKGESSRRNDRHHRKDTHKNSSKERDQSNRHGSPSRSHQSHANDFDTPSSHARVVYRRDAQGNLPEPPAGFEYRRVDPKEKKKKK